MNSEKTQMCKIVCGISVILSLSFVKYQTTKTAAATHTKNSNSTMRIHCKVNTNKKNNFKWLNIKIRIKDTRTRHNKHITQWMFDYEIVKSDSWLKWLKEFLNMCMCECLCICVFVYKYNLLNGSKNGTIQKYLYFFIG